LHATATETQKDQSQLVATGPFATSCNCWPTSSDFIILFSGYIIYIDNFLSIIYKSGMCLGVLHRQGCGSVRRDIKVQLWGQKDKAGVPVGM